MRQVAEAETQSQSQTQRCSYLQQGLDSQLHRLLVRLCYLGGVVLLKKLSYSRGGRPNGIRLGTWVSTHTETATHTHAGEVRDTKAHTHTVHSE